MGTRTHLAEFMKKRALSSFLLLFFLGILSHPVSAHLSGQPPFFTINGKFTGYYPIQSNAYIADFTIPQDAATETYLKDAPLAFAIDATQIALVFPKEYLDRIAFQWDFGDGEKGTGWQNTHVYKKAGSYILTIHADTSKIQPGQQPQLIQSVLFHVVPDRNYKPPEAAIRINGADPVASQSSILVDFSKKIAFDASASHGSAAIASVQWDFDDGNSAKEAKLSHQYGLPRMLATPILRVVDANGFIADTSVTLIQDETKKQGSNTGLIAGAGIGIAVLMVAGTMLILKKKP